MKGTKMEDKHLPAKDDVVREVRIWGDFLPPSDDVRIEGPWSFQEAWHLVLRNRYDVTVAMKTPMGEGTIMFCCTKKPGIIDMKDALLREWYVCPKLAGAVAVYARAHIDGIPGPF